MITADEAAAKARQVQLQEELKRYEAERERREALHNESVDRANRLLSLMEGDIKEAADAGEFYVEYKYFPDTPVDLSTLHEALYPMGYNVKEDYKPDLRSERGLEYQVIRISWGK